MRIELQKERLRRLLRKRLIGMSASQRRRRDEQACRNLASTRHFQDASVVMLYLSMPYELETAEIIRLAWSLGKTVAVPRTSPQDRLMVPVRMDSFEDVLTVNFAGLRNPVNGSAISPEHIELVVAPALAFDEKGNRLGRGKSYYDNFFADSRLKAVRCGLAYQQQLLDSIPVTNRDQRVHFVVTNELVINCNNGKGQSYGSLLQEDQVR